MSSKNMDEKRQRQNAYEYLCRLEEARRWVSGVLKKDLPPSCELEMHLRNGIDLAHLASCIAPKECPPARIYDPDFKRFQQRGLHFRHTDNIIMFIRALQSVKLPKVFYPETTDIYDSKNMLKCIFCLHALSHYLASKGILPLISSLYGEVKFEEQEISMIQKYLEKSGVKMPAFSKIGGILASELSEDDAAVHAAVILFSEAIDRGDPALLFERLSDPVLRFLNLRNQNMDEYLRLGSVRKARKVELVETKVADSHETSDIYDKILSRAEMQDVINTSNSTVLLGRLNLALKSGDQVALRTVFADECFGVGAVSEYGGEYVKYCTEYYTRLGDPSLELTFEDVKEIVKAVNAEQARSKAAREFVAKVDAALKSNDITALASLLSHAPDEFLTLDTTKQELIFASLQHLNVSDGFDRTTLAVALRLTDIVVAINKAVDERDHKGLGTHLQRPELCLSHVQGDSAQRYLEALVECRTAKNEAGASAFPYLMVEDITITVNSVNKAIKEENDRLEILSKINDGLGELSSEEVFKLLSDPRSSLKNVRAENSEAYDQGLRLRVARFKAKTGDTSSHLWLKHVQEVIDTYNTHMGEVRAHVAGTDQLNKALLDPSPPSVLELLRKFEVTGLIPECDAGYREALKALLSTRHVKDWTGWLDHSVRSANGQVLYYNHTTGAYVWEMVPQGYSSDIGFLNARLAQEVCSRVGSEYNRELYFKSNVDLVIILQKYQLTIDARITFKKHINFIHRELPNIIVLQAYTRMVEHRHDYIECLRRCHTYSEEGRVLKQMARSYVESLNYQRKLTEYLENVKAVVALQSRLRSHFAQSDYNNLIHMHDPSLKQVYKYLGLLDMDENDVFEERELKRFWNLAHEKVREIGELENDVSVLYVTIGLLVKNRIDMHGLESRSGRSKKRLGKVETTTSGTKEQMELREKYGHMFYILQRVPVYSARLVLCLSRKRSAVYVRELLLNLFNLGTSQRDEYHLVRAFETLLELEIAANVDTIKAFSKEDSLATKLAVAYCRDTKAATFLHTMFAQPISELLKASGLLTVSPVEVYKQWISSVESQTGTTSDLPYDVEAEQALKHPEVCTLLKKNVDAVIIHATALRDSIVHNASLLPYSIRYFAKCVQETLRRKFENATEEELLKVIVIILLYRLLNPALVGPEGYNLLGGKTDVSTEQRRNLATVSSILQNAAVGKLLDTAHPLLADLDEFMRDTERKFATFFAACVHLKTPEEHFNIHEFSDRTQLNVPELKLTYSAILDMHRLLLEHSDVVFPTENDILFTVVNSIGEVPKVTDLAAKSQPTKPVKGEPQVVESEEEELLNTLTTLSLLPPKEFLETDENRHRKLLTQTVTLFVDILRFSFCETIPEVLESTFTEQQETDFRDLLVKRNNIVALHEQRAVSVDFSQLPTLASTLAQVKDNLATLEEAKVISIKNDHHDMLLELVRKLSERTRLLKARRMDIAMFRTTVDDLNTKLASLNKQQELYNLCIKGCVQNMSQKKKKSKIIVVKERADKLAKKGVIVKIDNMSENKFKNITFEFKNTNEPGTFQVCGKLMGVTMDTYTLVFSDLLQLKFNNVLIIKILDAVTVRVNVLVHFINQHFYV